MNIDELNEKCHQISRAAEVEVNRLRDEFTILHSKYDVGDIIEDHYHIILVEGIRVYNRTECSCYYVGTQLTKELVPFKKQTDTKMYSDNVERKLN